MSDDTYISYNDGVSNIKLKDEAATLTPLPEIIVVNGVTYVRETDEIDRQVNNIKAYLEIASRTGLTLRQVIWFRVRGDGDSILPD